jgi:exopolysaccharide biosynthesis predicted pyruvyltransferase EpsI
MLAGGRVVVTDRLHGVILSLQMSIPVVAVDNANHKVDSFVRTWLQNVRDVHLAPSHAVGLEIARSLTRTTMASG